MEIAELLVSHGADVDAQDVHGNTPLFRAVFDSLGRGGLIKLLLQHVADKSLENKHGVSAMQLSYTIVNYDVGKFLRDGAE